MTRDWTVPIVVVFAIAAAFVGGRVTAPVVERERPAEVQMEVSGGDPGGRASVTQDGQMVELPPRDDRIRVVPGRYARYARATLDDVRRDWGIDGRLVCLVTDTRDRDLPGTVLWSLAPHSPTKEAP